MKPLLYAAILLASWPASGNENRLRNGGFEQGGPALANWSIPPYWSGEGKPTTKPEHVRTGKRAARLTTASKGGRWWGRVLQVGPGETHLGRRTRLSIWAKGKGQVLLGVIRYTAPVPGKPHYHYLWQEQPVELNDTWQEVVLEFTILEPRFIRLATAIELRGEGSEAFLDDAAFTEPIPPGLSTSLSPRHPMAATNQPVTLRFRVDRDGAPQPGKVLIQLAPPEGEPVTTTAELPVGSDELVHTFTPDQAGLWRATLIHLGHGVSESTFVDVLPPPQFAPFQTAAEKLLIPDGTYHVLVLGDSLTDFLRGRNYVDKTNFWLQQRGGSRCTVRNAGVGGDFITRVWDRLNAKPKTYRLAMYDQLYEPKPQRVFLFLGHNDSKTSSTSGHRKHCVDPDTFRDLYRRSVAKIQADTGAQVTILSATSSVFEITKANADKRAAIGKAHSLFGDPVHLETFNRIAKGIAKELHCDYIDVYQPTRDHPQKKTLFAADGVHLSNAGNQLIALEILRYLGTPDGDGE